MVSGFDVVPTRRPRVIQCGDRTRTARGFGSSRPSCASNGPAWPGSMANVGEPWETKREGMRSMAHCGRDALACGAVHLTSTLKSTECMDEWNRRAMRGVHVDVGPL